jgi:alkaline phosphatase
MGTSSRPREDESTTPITPGNAYRAMVDTQELDEAIGAAAQMVDLRDTLIIVSVGEPHAYNGFSRDWNSVVRQSEK